MKLPYMFMKIFYTPEGFEDAVNWTQQVPLAEVNNFLSTYSLQNLCLYLEKIANLPHPKIDPNDLCLAAMFPPYEELKNVNMVMLQEFHNYTMLILTAIMSMISIFMISKIFCKYNNTRLLSSRSLELIWTFIPMIVLLLIAIPSLKFLYLMDLSTSPAVTLKVFGAQWYWMYQYGDFENFTISSYMLKDKELLEHQNKFLLGWRLLETDTRAILPYSSETRILVTSQDVIHSFSMPGLGIKIDAVPGRLNWITLFNFSPGWVYGQCSEICGVGHSFMPIIIEFVSFKDFTKTLKFLSSE